MAPATRRDRAPPPGSTRIFAAADITGALLGGHDHRVQRIQIHYPPSETNHEHNVLKSQEKRGALTCPERCRNKGPIN
jgi:hypothetical protein